MKDEDEKIKKFFKLLTVVEKLLIRLISIVGWLKILIDIIT